MIRRLFMKTTPLDRILLLFTGLLAAYQIAVGIDDFGALPVIAYTIAFGVLLVAGLLLIIWGFDILESPVVVIVSTVIPLALSLGLVWQYLVSLQSLYLVFAILGFLAITLTRAVPAQGKLATIVLAFVHGIAGLTIFLLPIVLAVQGKVHPLFSLVGVGGALIGVGGLALSFLKAGKPILSKELIFKILSAILFLMTLCFVIGFKYG
ncbi:conserved hypothetical protein [Candidatus Denitrolinea symbiosum]|nr:conserved hypothetical protein [Candidatus Denitrolinea symbiosum]